MTVIDVICLATLRERARKFCADRQWEEFHLPPSLALALSGECGEVCEIFQWKGTMEFESMKATSKKEIIHIGEEVADVLIYSTRLADVCELDLSQAVNDLLNSNSTISDKVGNIMLDELCKSPMVKLTQFRSPRHVCFELQRWNGAMCTLFATNSEVKSQHGLSLWSETDTNTLRNALANMVILMATLAHFYEISLAHCVSDKFAKNAAKYPVELATGSSAKYTKYVEQRDAAKRAKEVGEKCNSDELIRDLKVVGITLFVAASVGMCAVLFTRRR